MAINLLRENVVVTGFTKDGEHYEIHRVAYDDFEPGDFTYELWGAIAGTPMGRLTGFLDYIFSIRILELEEANRLLAQTNPAADNIARLERDLAEAVGLGLEALQERDARITELEGRLRTMWQHDGAHLVRIAGLKEDLALARAGREAALEIGVKLERENAALLTLFQRSTEYLEELADSAAFDRSSIDVAGILDFVRALRDDFEHKVTKPEEPR